MKVVVPPHMVTDNPCLKPIQKCVDVGVHEPVCRCFLPTGHEERCLPVVTIAMMGKELNA